MSFPLVSCIVPVFNGERYLAEALDSILAQTYPNIEIIAVDDGSTDDTPHVLNRFEGKITRLTQSNAGPAGARNSGLHASKGDLIAFLDADDLWHPDKIRLQMQYLAERPELEVCFTLVRNFWAPELLHEKERLEKEGLVKLIHPFSVCSFLGRRSVFEKVGEFRTELVLGEDSDWFARMRDAGTANDVLPEKLVRRRLHEKNLTRNISLISRQELRGTALAAVENQKRGKIKPEEAEEKGQHEKAEIFFNALYESFLGKEKISPDPGKFYYEIAGRVVRLRFAGASLVPLLTPALEHLRVSPSAEPELTVCLCDFSPGGAGMPALPWSEADLTVRRDIRGFDDDGHIRGAYQEGPGMLHLLHTKKNLALFCVKDVSGISQPDRGAPLARIFKWWMRKHGIQLVHAGVIGNDRGAVILAGKGGSGKSTTALACLASGLSYVSDDYCLITGEAPFTAHSLYCSGKMHTRDLARLPVLAAKAGPGEPDESSGKTLFFLDRAFPERIKKQLPLRAVLVPVIHPEPESELVRASASAALRELAPSTLFQMPGWKSEDFYRLARIADALPCYVFRIGSDPALVTRAVSEFLSRPTS